MRSVEVFIQGGELAEMQVATAAPADSLAGVLAALERPISLQDQMLVFVQDMHCPIDPETAVEELLPLCSDEESIVPPLHIHVTKCRHVEVSVRFNGERVKRRFPPGATVGRVHHWAARRAFHLAPRDAAEHVLEIAGSHKRPDRDVHVGTLTGGAACSVEFDLVPRKRVEG
jgi:hypothetical protein